jgi:hypothetical protein
MPYEKTKESRFELGWEEQKGITDNRKIESSQDCPCIRVTLNVSKIGYPNDLK